MHEEALTDMEQNLQTVHLPPLILSGAIIPGMPHLTSPIRVLLDQRQPYRTPQGLGFSVLAQCRCERWNNV